MVVDIQGAPIKGALVMPESDGDRMSDTEEITPEDRAKRISDAQGLIHADIGLYYWQSDDCFHFVVTKEGYDDTSFSVSRSLFPSLLKIIMDLTPKTVNSKPAPGTPAPRAK